MNTQVGAKDSGKFFHADLAGRLNNTDFLSLLFGRLPGDIAQEE